MGHFSERETPAGREEAAGGKIRFFRETVAAADPGRTVDVAGDSDTRRTRLTGGPREENALPLLAYLTVRRDVFLSRQELYDAFFPEHQDGLQRIRNAIRVIRNLFPGTIENGRRGTSLIRFQPKGILDIDILSFYEDLSGANSAIDPAKALLDAIKSYREPVMDGLLPAVGTKASEVLQAERVRLRVAAFKAYGDLLAIYRQKDGFEERRRDLLKLALERFKDPMPTELIDELEGAERSMNTATWQQPASKSLHVEVPSADIGMVGTGVSRLYLGNTPLPALRLVGAADQLFDADMVTVEADLSPYQIPAEFADECPEVIEMLATEMRERGIKFFNGPNTRLDGWNEETDPMTERVDLVLHFGPMPWYDFRAIQWLIRDMSETEIARFVDLSDVENNRSIQRNRLPNILDTATTLLCKDGFLVYSKRSSKLATVPSIFTSAVAENISQELDNSLGPTAPDALPAPFKTVLRGISEEISPYLEWVVPSLANRIICTGLSFGTRQYHPSMLFLVALPLTWHELIAICRRYPGRDWSEGTLHAVSLARSEEETLHELTDKEWTGGGGASVCRALEIVKFSRRDLFGG